MVRKKKEKFRKDRASEKKVEIYTEPERKRKRERGTEKGK